MMMAGFDFAAGALLFLVVACVFLAFLAGMFAVICHRDPDDQSPSADEMLRTVTAIRENP
jgi:hypothetical protein